jgi:hypothetical protein
MESSTTGWLRPQSSQALKARVRPFAVGQPRSRIKPSWEWWSEGMEIGSAGLEHAGGDWASKSRSVGHRRRHHRRSRAAGQAARHRRPRTGSDVLVAGLANSVRHDVVGRPRGLIAGAKVRCEVVERDRHGRLVAKVFSPNGIDIGRRLASSGWAWRTGGTRRTTSLPRTRLARPSAGCGRARS